MPEVPAANPDIQLKVLIGELVVTIANLEAQKAALAAQVVALTPNPEATA